MSRLRQLFFLAYINRVIGTLPRTLYHTFYSYNSVWKISFTYFTTNHVSLLLPLPLFPPPSLSPLPPSLPPPPYPPTPREVGEVIIINNKPEDNSRNHDDTVSSGTTTCVRMIIRGTMTTRSLREPLRA